LLHRWRQRWRKRRNQRRGPSFGGGHDKTLLYAASWARRGGNQSSQLEEDRATP